MLVTFDCYGTLLDTAPVGAALATIAERAGVAPRAAEAVYSVWESRLMFGDGFLPFEDLLEEVLRRCDMDLRTGGCFSAGAADLRRAYEQLAPYPDAVPALDRLHASGMRLGVVSNTSRPLLDAHRRALAGLIDLSACADEIRAYKPRAAVFDRVEAWRTPGERHVHVAKGYWWDVEPARRRRWPAVWINRDGLVPTETGPHPPELATLTGLPELLQDA